MKLYERFLNAIEDGECTEEFEAVLEYVEMDFEDYPFCIDLFYIEKLCLVFNDDVEDYGYFTSLMHIMERSYSFDNELFVKSIVKGFAAATNCTRWASSFLNRLCNGGHTELIRNLINELNDDQKVNFSEVKALR